MKEWDPSAAFVLDTFNFVESADAPGGGTWASLVLYSPDAEIHIGASTPMLEAVPSLGSVVRVASFRTLDGRDVTIGKGDSDIRVIPYAALADVAFPELGIRHDLDFETLAEILNKAKPHWKLTRLTDRHSFSQALRKLIEQRQRKTRRKPGAGRKPSFTADDIGRVIKKARGNLTQKDAARQIGVSGQALRAWQKKHGFGSWEAVVEQYVKSKK